MISGSIDSYRTRLLIGMRLQSTGWHHDNLYEARDSRYGTTYVQPGSIIFSTLNPNCIRLNQKRIFSHTPTYFSAWFPQKSK